MDTVDDDRLGCMWALCHCCSYGSHQEKLEELGCGVPICDVRLVVFLERFEDQWLASFCEFGL